MREIIASIDDSGRTEVKIKADPSSGRFLTKREFMNALRAIKLGYRRAIKEHRRGVIKKEVIKELENEDRKEKGNEVKSGERTGERTGSSESVDSSSGCDEKPVNVPERRKGVITFGARS